MSHTLILGIVILALVWVPALLVRPETEPENDI